jgi:putative ABC transport system permease protein
LSPRLARNLLLRCLPTKNREPIVGDFEEMYADVAARRGRGRAVIWYWGQVVWSICACVCGFVQEQFHDVVHRLEYAARTIVKNRRYSITSIAGLSLAFTLCLLFSAFVVYELSYDRYQENSARIYRISTTSLSNTAPGLLAPAVEQQSPHVDHAARVLKNIFGDLRITRGERSEYSEQLFFGDSGVFDVFGWSFADRIDGPLLDDPFTVVITRSAAARFFGTADPIGMPVTINDHDYTVTGVVDNIPQNSHFRFEFLASLESAEILANQMWNRQRLSTWDDVLYATYLLLDDPSRVDSVEDHIVSLLRENDAIIVENEDEIYLQSLTRVYLGRGTGFQVGTNGNTKHLVGIVIATLLIVVVAGVNIVNLVVAGWHLDERREPATGPEYRFWSLVKRFGSEAFLVGLLAASIALLAARLLLPVFSDIVARELVARLLFIPWIVLFVALFSAVTAAVAARYPLLFIVRNDPRRGTRATTPTGYSGGRQGGVLATFQYVIASALVFMAVLVAIQIQFVVHKPLGYDKSNLVVIPLKSDDMNSEQICDLKQKLRSLPGVSAATASDNVPTGIVSLFEIRRPGGDQNDVTLVMQKVVDHEFLNTYGITPVTDYKSGPESLEMVLVNRTAVEALGWEEPEDAVGQEFKLRGGRDAGSHTIDGVFEDYHQFSLHKKIRPLVLFVIPSPEAAYMSLRLDPHNSAVTLASVEHEFARFDSRLHFNPFWMEDKVAAYYVAERRLVRQLNSLAAVVMLITCVGLLGFAGYSTCRRRDEILSLRENGVGTVGIAARFTGRLAAKIAVANAVSLPIAYIAVEQWLGGFAYRTNPEPAVLLVAGATVTAAGVIAVAAPIVTAALATRRSADRLAPLSAER